MGGGCVVRGDAGIERHHGRNGRRDGRHGRRRRRMSVPAVVGKVRGQVMMGMMMHLTVMIMMSGVRVMRSVHRLPGGVGMVDRTRLLGVVGDLLSLLMMLAVVRSRLGC